MSIKKKCALMHLEAMAKGKAEQRFFGYRIQMEYQGKDILVRITGRGVPSIEEIEKMVVTTLLFGASAYRESISLGLSLKSKRKDVFHINDKLNDSFFPSSVLSASTETT